MVGLQCRLRSCISNPLPGGAEATSVITDVGLISLLCSLGLRLSASLFCPTSIFQLIDGIPVELFQVLKDAVKPANLENSAVATGLERVSFHSSPNETQCQKNAQTTAHLHSSHTLAK